ncbi:efflux RND transporter permease subunit, partial [Undibacterium sp. 10I3]
AVVLVEALMVRLALKHHDLEHQSNLFLWRKQVLKKTVVEMGHPILFAKAIIILAFIPIFTFQRVEGKIFSPVALTLSFAMLGALILTMTLIPTLLALTMKRHSLAEKHSNWMQAIQDWYRKLLYKADGQKRTVMIVSCIVLAITLLLAPRLGSEFLPKLDEGNIWLTVSLPPSTALEKTREVERQVRAILLSYPEVSTVVSQVGRPDDGTDPKGPNSMEILVDLKPHDQWKFADKESLIESMTAKIGT